MTDSGTATITGAGYSFTMYLTSVTHQLDKTLIINEVPAKGLGDTLTWLIDLRRCKEGITLNGYLLDTSTSSGLTQKAQIIQLMRKTAANLTLTWGEAGTYETIEGNIAKVDIKEETGRLTGDSPGSETKRYNIQLVFIRGTHRG